MAIIGSHVLIICNDMDEDAETAFNEWYIREHVRDRILGMDGFLRGRRFVNVRGGRKYCALYEVESPTAFSNPRYVEAQREPDPRSRQFIPKFKNAARTTLRVVASAGLGDGALLGLVVLSPVSGDTISIDKAAASAAVETIVANPGITSASVWQADEEALQHTKRVHLRSNDIEYPGAIAIEATDDESLSRVLQNAALLSETTDTLGVTASSPAVYHMIFNLQRSPQVAISR